MNYSIYIIFLQFQKRFLSVTSNISNIPDSHTGLPSFTLLELAITFCSPYSFLSFIVNSEPICPNAPVISIFSILQPPKGLIYVVLLIFILANLLFKYKELKIIIYDLIE